MAGAKQRNETSGSPSTRIERGDVIWLSCSCYDVGGTRWSRALNLFETPADQPVEGNNLHVTAQPR